VSQYLPRENVDYPCPDDGCHRPCATNRIISVEDAPYENAVGEWVCPGYCYQQSPPETFELAYEMVQAVRKEREQSPMRGASDLQVVNKVKTCAVKRRPIVCSGFAGESWFNISIATDGTRIHVGKYWLTFRGAQQWQVIDALFNAWKDNFGKVEIGDKSEIEKVFGSKHGRYLLKFIHFETRKEAGLAKRRGNYQYTGNAWFDRKLIYPDKFALKKE